MRFFTILLVSLTILRAGAPAAADEAILSDPLLEKLVGRWDLTGTIMGKPARHSVEAHWILAHHYLQIHEIAAPNPKTGKPDYEALPIIGYEDKSGRYIAYWLDMFGEIFSQTIGSGRRSGDRIEFVFDYPDGPFHNDFIWDERASEWRWHMTNKNAQGEWSEFGDVRLTRARR